MNHPAHTKAIDPESIELLLRVEWWLNHGVNCLPYGDDGQMQCCGLDFLKHLIDQLQERVNELRTKTLRTMISYILSLAHTCSIIRWRCIRRATC